MAGGRKAVDNVVNRLETACAAGEWVYSGFSSLCNFASNREHRPRKILGRLLTRRTSQCTASDFNDIRS